MLGRHCFTRTTSGGDRRILRDEKSSSSDSTTTPSRMRWMSRKRQSHPSHDGDTPTEHDSSLPNDDMGCPCCSDAPWRVENILNTPPSPADWWNELTQPSKDIEEDGGEYHSSIQQRDISDRNSNQEDMTKEFRNCGYNAWEKARAAWRTPSESAPLQSPPPLKASSEVIRGFSGARQYDLPVRVSLSDIVSIYNDLWKCEGTSHTQSLARKQAVKAAVRVRGLPLW